MRYLVEIPDETLKHSSRRQMMGAGYGAHLARVYQWIAKNGTRAVDSNRVGDPSVTKHFDGAKSYVDVKNVTFTDPYEVLKFANVDMEKWELVQSTINPYQCPMKLRQHAGETSDGKPIYVDKPHVITLYQIKCWIKPRVDPYVNAAFDRFMDRLDKLKPKPPAKREYKIPASSKYCGEIIPVDAHFLKFGWHPETLGGHQDLKISKKMFVDACAANLGKMAAFPLQKIHFIVGNDLFHSENMAGTTPKGGNVLDIDGRLPKGIEVVLDAFLEVAEMCLEVAPVEFIWVPGNHDYVGSMWFSHVLNAYFRNDPNVRVDISPAPKKARLWGDLLIGWWHDASGRKAMASINELPQFWPDLWGKSRWREIHVGHKHKADVVKTKPVTTLGGTIIRQCAGLTTIDAWHSEEFFTDAVPACESYVWHKDDGVAAMFNQNIDYLKSAA
jgi:hypothetical protein